MSMMILEPLKIPLSDFLDAESEVHNTDALTGIHGRIHCAATQQGEALSETDRIQVNHFFDVLAGVVLAVAKRRLTSDQVTKTCEQ